MLSQGRFLVTHSQNSLSFIRKDTKPKDLERTDYKNYFYYGRKFINSKIKQITDQNEQSIINGSMKLLNKNGEIHIDGFDFKKLLRLD